MKGLVAVRELVVVVDLGELVTAHHLVATIHLLDAPFERVDHLGRLAEDLGDDQMRQLFVDVELDHLGIDQDQPELVGRVPVQQADDHAIEADALT